MREAQLALGASGDSLRATANPIELQVDTDAGRTWLLSAQLQAYALGLTLAFICVLLAAAALAAERDENVIGRLARGLIRLGDLVIVKVLLAGLVAVVLGLAIALLFGALSEFLDVTGGEPWQRLPILLVGLALAGVSFGAFGALVGALSRDSRTAVLVAFLTALPLVLLGLVPEGAAKAAWWAAHAFPFSHAVDFFQAALYETDPWRTLARRCCLAHRARPCVRRGRSSGRAKIAGVSAVFPVTRLRRFRRTDCAARPRARSARRRP